MSWAAHRSRTRLSIAALAAAALIVAGCSSAGASPSPAGASPSPAGSAPGEIAATLSEWKIGLSAAGTPPGRTVFNITNGGATVHEFLVIRTDMMAADLPVRDHMIDVAAMGGPMGTGMDMPGMSPEGEMEHPAGTVGEVEDIAAGATAQLALDDMEPGHYAIVCNIATHYEQGMHTDFTVGT